MNTHYDRGCPQRLRCAKWAGVSRSQTHRRAAMGGFTLDDGYVRGVAADAQRFTGSVLDLLLDVPNILPEHNSLHNSIPGTDTGTGV